MDEHGFRAAVKRLHEVNKVVAELDPAIRSQAFAVLSGYVTGSADRTLSELGEIESSLLQVLMDQKATLEEMIANVMKSISETQSALAGNLKSS